MQSEIEWGILKPFNVKWEFNNGNNNFWVYLISTMKIWNKTWNSNVFKSELNLKEITTQS